MVDPVGIPVRRDLIASTRKDAGGVHRSVGRNEKLGATRRMIEAA